MHLYLHEKWNTYDWNKGCGPIPLQSQGFVWANPDPPEEIHQGRTKVPVVQQIEAPAATTGF